MKNISFFFLCILFVFTSATAKNVPEYVYKTCINEKIELLDVERTDSNTVLSFKCSGIPGEEWSLPSVIYLDDELQNKYNLRSSNGVKLGEPNKYPMSGDSFFSLEFEALPKHVKIFDLLTENHFHTHFGIWGIHVGKLKLQSPIHNAHLLINDKPFAEPGSVTINVCIEDSSVYNIRSIDLDYASIFNDTARTRFNNKEDGCFELTTAIDGASWTYIVFDKQKKIPVFLYPGDTVQVHVEHLYDIDRRTSYISSKSNDLMHSLMKADPMLIDWQLQNSIDSPQRLDSLYMRISSKMETLSDLHNYLVWKYQLSDKESHLLDLGLKEYVSFYLIRGLRKTFLNLYTIEDLYNMDPASVDSIVMNEEFKQNYSLLLNFSPKDYSFFALPDRTIVGYLKNLPLSLMRRQRENRMPSRYFLIEKLLGESFDNAWLKQLGEINK